MRYFLRVILLAGAVGMLASPAAAQWTVYDFSGYSYRGGYYGNYYGNYSRPCYRGYSNYYFEFYGNQPLPYQNIPGNYGY